MSTPGRRRLDREAELRLEDALGLVAEHHVGKRRRSVERALGALHERDVDRLARGKPWFSAGRRWLAARAGMHVRTFDSAVRDLEQLGLVEVRRRKVRADLNLPNLWRLAGAASLGRLAEPRPAPRKLHSGTETLTFALDPTEVDLDQSVTSTPRARARDRRGFREYRNSDDFSWPEGSAEHPALHGLDEVVRNMLAAVYELVRDGLNDAGAVAPEGGRLAAIRRWWQYDCGYFDDRPTVGDVLDAVDEALGDFLEWLREGGPLAYSMGWMHKYRRVPSPPPSMLFGTFSGEVEDRSGGADPFGFWLEGLRHG